MTALPTRCLSVLRHGAYLLPSLAAFAGMLLLTQAVQAAQKGGAAKGKSSPPIHALLQVERETVGDLQAQPARMSPEEFADFLELQIALLKSRLILNGALKAPEVANLPTVKQQKDPAEWLEQRLKVDAVKRTGILRIAVTGGDVQEQALLANAVAEAYLQEIVDREQRKRQARLDQLKKYYADYGSRLRDRRETLRRMNLAVGGNDAQLLQFTLKQVAAIEKELLEAQAQIRKAKIEILMAKAKEHEKPGDLPLPPDALEEALRKDPAAAGLREQIARAEQWIADVEKRSANPSAEPIYQNMQAQLDGARKELAGRRDILRARLQEHMQNQQKYTQQGAQQRIEVLHKVEGLLNEERENALKAIQNLKKSAVDMDWLRDEVRDLEEVGRDVTRQIQQLEVTLQAPPRARLLQKAAAPGK
jgi:polysaccharide biosynthesis transport protein